jgi:hypothetical protein
MDIQRHEGEVSNQLMELLLCAEPDATLVESYLPTRKCWSAETTPDW